jgi:hypothetical protein
MPSLKGRTLLVAVVASTLLVQLAGALAQGCSSDDRDLFFSTAATTPTSTTLQKGEALPGLALTIRETAPGTGPAGNLQVGDAVRVTFEVRRDDGTLLTLDELDSCFIVFAGPTFSYQPVLGARADVIAAATTNSDGSYTYAFPDPIPATYAAPYNDTPSFGAGDGERQGQPLLSGTYTVGLNATKTYTEGARTYTDVGSTTFDVRFGAATTIERREVVSDAACSRCHGEVRGHQGTRTGVSLCVLCHTAGAEDKNVPTIEGGTPGTSVDLRVLIHRIHTGSHLPSVLGVATASDGSRSYTATPRPFHVVTDGGGIVSYTVGAPPTDPDIEDFSEVNFPLWPWLTVPMPRDLGHSALPSTAQALENSIRSGVTACFRCHGDPDDAGPLVAPAQGDVALSQPSRRACGSCHDDVDWTRPYTANGLTMPPQVDDSSCASCHTPTSIDDAHRHPMLDPLFNPGLNGRILDAREAGTNDGDGLFEPGERIQVQFAFTNDAGIAVVPTGASTVQVLLAGPNGNRNLLLSSTIAVNTATATIGGQGGTGPWTFNLPQVVQLERIGTPADAGAIETLYTSRAPLWDPLGAPATTLRQRTGFPVGGGSTTTIAALASGASFNLLSVATITGLAANDYVVIDDGLLGEEYAQVARVDGSTVWFTTSLRNGHAAGASVREVTLASRTLNTHYTLDAATGGITEVGVNTLVAGQTLVAVQYTSDYVIPAAFPAPLPSALNDSPALDETWGEWTGKPLVAGTYRLAIYGRLGLNLDLFGERNAYGPANEAATRDLSFIAASATPVSVIPDLGASCAACHGTLIFHGGGRRGFETCVMCHTVAGAEDRARYRRASASDTPGVTVDFRTMLHRIHRGEELVNEYKVEGNSAASTFDEVVFPRRPGGVADCASCHGAGGTWHYPGSLVDAREWRAVCSGCHDSTPAIAHIDAQTGLGVESCAVCHGPGGPEDVERVHVPR